MNQQIVDYFQENKENYSQESLIEQLRNAGHSDTDINDAIGVVYGQSASALQVNSVPAGNVRYAGFWIRFVAILIDSLVVGFIVILFAIPISFVDTTGVLSSILGLVILMAYAILMTHKYQATLGKMAVGIKVCNKNDLGKATIGHIALREIANRVIMYIPFVNLTVPFIIAFTQKKQGLHDFAAKTVVIYKDPNKKMNGAIIAVIVFVIGLVVIAIIGILASIVLVSLNSARDKAKDASAKSAISSTVPSAILCMDGGYDISDPQPGTPICSGSQGTWPELGLTGEWSGVIDGRVSDGTFEYTATYGTDGGGMATCRQTGCVFDE